MDVGIVGLGLIGGSMVKAISANTDHTVFGYDRDERVLAAAEESGAIASSLESCGGASCDMLIVALVPKAAAGAVRAHAGALKPGAVVVDCCGIKRAIEEDMRAACREVGAVYIGGHPMAGIERNGFENSFAELFAGASMILTPSEDTPAEALALAEELFLAAGFGSIKLSRADEHDRMIALTSQLAHVVSGAYVKSPAAEHFSGFSAGSFKDMTRVARLDEEMWTELFLDNADYLSAEIDALIGRLGDYSEAIKAADARRLRALLREGREIKERL